MSGIDLKKAFEATSAPPGWQGDLFFYNRIGQKIRYGYAPAQGERKGSVVLTHGYGEHIDLYYETIKKYQDMGYDVWGMDWQGHGFSEHSDPKDPMKPSSSGMLRHTRDLDFFVNNIVKTEHDPDTPLIMSTHSMGGHIGLLYLKKYPGVFDAAVMSAPMFDIYRVGLGGWARPLVKLAFNIASNFLGLRDIQVPDAEWAVGLFSRIGKGLSNIFNPRTSTRYKLRDLIKELTPEANIGRPTFGWIAEAYNTIDLAMKDDFLKSIKTPILIGSAEHEDLVDNAAHERAASLMPHAEHVTIKGAGHGLWFSDDGPFNEWWNKIAGFVSKVKAVNPHEMENNEIINQIVAGDDIEKNLRGRIICIPRGPCRAEDIKPPFIPEDPVPI